MHFDWLLVRLQLKCGSKLSKLHCHVEIITAEMVSVRENSSQQNRQKQYLLRLFLEILGYKTFVKIYLILPEILSVINSRECGFTRILKSEGGYWVPETLVEQSKTRNEHGSGTQIESPSLSHEEWACPGIEPTTSAVRGTDVNFEQRPCHCATLT
jgi:hypothetical protein